LTSPKSAHCTKSGIAHKIQTQLRSKSFRIWGIFNEIQGKIISGSMQCDIYEQNSKRAIDYFHYSTAGTDIL
jgi:hypothetical protein